MIYRTVFIGATLFGWLTLLTQAQQLNYKITHFGTKDGLSQGSIYAILKDSYGQMWFGSQDGLNVHDGKRIISFFPDNSKPESLSGSKINSLAEDNHGNIWVGTENGLSCYHIFSKKFSQYLKGQEVNIIRVYAGKIYLWSSVSGYLRLNLANKKLERFFDTNEFDSNYTNTFNSSEIISANEYWIHQNHSVVHYKNGQRKYYFSNHKDNVAGEVMLITKLKVINEYVYAGTEDGLVILNTETNNLKKITELHGIPLNLVLDFEIDQNGALWICIDNNGVLYHNPRTNTHHHFKRKEKYRPGLWANLASYIYLDNTNTVWVNVDPFGVDKIELLTGNFHHQLINFPLELPEVLANQSIRSFNEDGENLWVGTLQTGIWLLDKNNFEAKKYFNSYNTKGFPSDRIFDMARHPDGRMFAATERGLLCIEGGKVEYIDLPKYKNAVAGLLVRSLQLFADNLFLSTEEGIVVYDTRKKIMQPGRKFPKLKMELTHHLSSDAYFYGSIGGGFWLWENNKSRVILSSEIPLFILPVQKNKEEFWVGTNNGLYRVDSRGKILRHYTSHDGLPNNFIYQGQYDDYGNLWLSTNRGIACFSENERFFSFNLNDGLQDYEYNAFASWENAAGRIFFGGVNGFNHFLPSEIQFPQDSIVNILRPESRNLKLVDFKGFLETQTSFERPDLKNPSFTTSFKELTTVVPNFLYTSSVGWVHTKIQNDSRKKWFLEIENTRLNSVEVWLFEKGREVFYKKLGDELPFDFYPLRDPNPTFELDLLENQQYDIYIKAHTSRDFKLPMWLWSETELIGHQSDRKLIWGIFIGFILLISLYNTFLWLTIKDKTYFFYTLYILNFGLFQFCIYGFAFQYFWSNHPINEYAFLVFLSISYIFLTFFTWSFLELDNKIPLWKPVKNLLIISNVLFIFLLPFFYRNEFNYFSILTSIFLTTFFYLICYKLWNEEDRIVRYYALAVFSLSTATVWLALQNLGVVDASKQEYVLMTGSMVEIVLFSVALGYKFRRNILERVRQQKLRNEISSNLHDDLAASLSSLTMYAELSKRKAYESPELLNERFATIGQKSRGILEKVRTAVYELDPSHDANEDWLDRIIQFGKEVFEGSVTNFWAEVAVDFKPEKLKRAYRREMLYLFKEAINNAAKYAKANNVNLNVSTQANRIMLVLTDDGVGMDSLNPKTGNGLENMKKRAENCKAQFEIKSLIDKGTVILVLL